MGADDNSSTLYEARPRELLVRADPSAREINPIYGRKHPKRLEDDLVNRERLSNPQYLEARGDATKVATSVGHFRNLEPRSYNHYLFIREEGNYEQRAKSRGGGMNNIATT